MEIDEGNFDILDIRRVDLPSTGLSLIGRGGSCDRSCHASRGGPACPIYRRTDGGRAFQV